MRRDYRSFLRLLICTWVALSRSVCLESNYLSALGMVVHDRWSHSTGDTGVIVTSEKGTLHQTELSFKTEIGFVLWADIPPYAYDLGGDSSAIQCIIEACAGSMEISSDYVSFFNYSSKVDYTDIDTELSDSEQSTSFTSVTLLIDVPLSLFPTSDAELVYHLLSNRLHSDVSNTHQYFSATLHRLAKGYDSPFASNANATYAFSYDIDGEISLSFLVLCSMLMCIYKSQCARRLLMMGPPIVAATRLERESSHS